MPIVTCQECGKEFKAKGFNPPRKYCSQECHRVARYRETHETRQCVVCGEAFTMRCWRPKVTCSPACAGKLRTTRVKKRCSSCGTLYEVPWNRRHSSSFCSMECMGHARAKVSHRPNQRQLEHLLLCYSVREIAKQYGVTENAVRYWCKRLGVKCPSQKERARLRRLSSRQLNRIIEGKDFL